MAVFYWDQLFLVGWAGWVFLCSIVEKPFSIGLVETVEKVLAYVIMLREELQYCVSTENGWKSVLLRNINHIAPKTIAVETVDWGPIEHDLYVMFRSDET